MAALFLLPISFYYLVFHPNYPSLYQIESKREEAH